MAGFNGSGTFSRVYSSWVADRIAGTPITDTRMDDEFTGFVTGLTTTICRDGQSTTTARIPFAAGANVMTGAAAAVGLSITGDVGTGLWSSGATTNLSIAVAGTTRLSAGTAGVAVTGTLSSSGVFTGTTTAVFGANSGTGGAVKLYGATSGDATIKVAAAAGTSTIFQVPASNGTSGYVLTTDGSGVTSWLNPASIAGDLDVGTTAIVGGTTTRILYNNAGVLGEYTLSGTGTIVAMTAGPTFTGTIAGAALTLSTPLGAASGGTGVANNAASTLTISGNFATTLTVSATTGVTLPTTGTLATLAGTETFTNKTLTSPTLTTPVLGTPASGALTNCTGLPIAGTTGYGTGVATALAVNVGSAGAFVTFNGALGTPSSGTVTNLTGTASININGTVGATTAAAGLFTTLGTTGALTYGGVTLSNAVTGTGNMVLSASPTLTGTTTLATLAATTIGAFTLSGTVSGGGNQINNVIIGTSTPLAGSFTTIAGSGIISLTNTTEASDLTTASVVLAGGLSVAKDIRTSGKLILFTTEQVETVNFGANNRYGMGVASGYTALYHHNAGYGLKFGQYDGSTFTARMTMSASGVLSLSNTTEASDLTTASVVLAGGLSVAKSAIIGTHAQVGVTGSGGAAAAGGSMFVVNGTSDHYATFAVQKANTTNPQVCFIGINQASLYSEIQSAENNVATNLLWLNRQGGNVSVGPGITSFTGSTTASSTSAAALVVTGGVGIGDNLRVANAIIASGTITSVSGVIVQSTADMFLSAISTGTIQSAGVRLVGRQSSVDSEWSIVAAGSGLTTEALRFVPGVWTGSPAFTLNGQTLATGKATVSYSTTASSTSAAALVVTGGVGIGDNLRVANAIYPGAGIAFPATQASSADANTLDDYEEGSWVPTYSGFSAAPSGGIFNYIKVGKMVTVWGSGSSAGTSNATTKTITLPFAALRGDDPVGMGLAFDNGAFKTNPCRIDLSASSATATVYLDLAGTGWTASGGCTFYFSFTYEATA